MSEFTLAAVEETAEEYDLRNRRGYDNKARLRELIYSCSNRRDSRGIRPVKKKGGYDNKPRLRE